MSHYFRYPSFGVDKFKSQLGTLYIKNINLKVFIDNYFFYMILSIMSSEDIFVIYAG
ncbi:hypothetical protein UT300019_27530 [Clostridium sp. CTA-19]